VVIVDDDTAVGAALVHALAERGHAAVRVAAPADVPAGQPVQAVVHLGALGGRGGRLVAIELFELARRFGDELAEAASAGPAALVGVTAMGGTFGLDGRPDAFDPWQGAVVGLLKTAAQEWPAVRVRAVDLAPCSADEAAGAVLAELLTDDERVEVGYRDGVRLGLELRAAAPPAADGPAPLDGSSVVLVTGGARGITAEVAAAMAARYRPTLVLLGRTDLLPDDEPLADVTDERELKRALFERARATGAPTTPAAVNAEYVRITRGREARDNVARLRAAGARVAYLQCDMADRASVAAAVAEVYDRYGRIDGVVHGAGVVEDKLLRDKELGSFERVLGPKAAGALHLVEALRPEGLRFLVFFSSVSGRFGNRGQGDYAAASEVLAKLAVHLDATWPARVVAIDWGPWAAGGMVTPEVRRQFAARGVGLIDVEAGCRAFDDELRRGSGAGAEVVIAADPAPPSNAPAVLHRSTVVVRADGGAEVVRALDVAHDHFLDDHRLDGNPVLPFAVAMELMGAAASLARPDLRLHGLRDIHLYRGVVLDGGATTVRLVADPREAASFAVRIETDGPRADYAAVVDLAPEGAQGAGDAVDAVAAPEPVDLPPFPMAVADAYRAYLFHGPRFQRIEALTGMGPAGASSYLRPSDPSACLHDLPPEAAWLLDPVLVDAALQVQVLWARVHWDVTLLPARIAGFRQLAPPPTTGTRVRHELRVRPSSRPPSCVADHWFLVDDRVVATLTAVEGVGSRALNRLAAP